MVISVLNLTLLASVFRFLLRPEEVGINFLRNVGQVVESS